MKGEIAAALELMRALHQAGADAADILVELAEFCHFVTRAKLAPGAADDPAISEIERERGREFAEKLTLGVLTRAWQILLKGVEDVKDSPRPLASAEMALIRLAFAADLPTPEDALRKLAEAADGPRPAPPLPPGGGARALRGGSPLRDPRRPSLRLPSRRPPRGPRSRVSRTLSRWRAPSATSSLSSRLKGRAACMLRAGQDRHSRPLRRFARIAQTLSRRLEEWTGERWMVALAAGSTAPTLRETAEARDAERFSGAGAHPLVRKVLERFRAPASSMCAAPRRRPRRLRQADETSATPISASTPPTTSEEGDRRHGHHRHDEEGAGRSGQVAGGAGGAGRLEVEGQAGGGMVR